MSSIIIFNLFLNYYFPIFFLWIKRVYNFFINIHFLSKHFFQCVYSSILALIQIPGTCGEHVLMSPWPRMRISMARTWQAIPPKGPKEIERRKTRAQSAQYYFSIYYQVPAAAVGGSRFDGFYFPEFSFY